MKTIHKEKLSADQLIMLDALFILDTRNKKQAIDFIDSLIKENANNSTKPNVSEANLRHIEVAIDHLLDVRTFITQAIE
jgi:hypothetical protein